MAMFYITWAEVMVVDVFANCGQKVKFVKRDSFTPGFMVWASIMARHR